MKSIAFIGAGNMAEALVKGLVSGGRNPSTITVTDTRPERLDFFRKEFGVNGSASNADAARGAGVIVLAVKPQVMAEVLPELKPAAVAALVVSIAAGIRADRIESALGGAVRVIRVMPNTPALVGAGVSAICRGRHATESDLEEAEQLLASVGSVVRVDEGQMDAVTAVSGSGPAYVFYVMENMLVAAAKAGLSDEVAKKLVYETVSGAAKLALSSDVGPSELRARVTSKGGTTAAAIGVLDTWKVNAAIVEAVTAARNRSHELSKG